MFPLQVLIKWPLHFQSVTQFSSGVPATGFGWGLSMKAGRRVQVWEKQEIELTRHCKKMVLLFQL